MADLPAPKESLLARYTGEAFKALRETAAAPYIAVARTLLGQLRHRLALGGVEAGAHSVTLPDGTKIKVGVYGAINKMWIEVPSKAGAVSAEFEFSYLSGLHEVTLFAAPLDDETKWAGQFYPARETPAGIDREWYRYSNTADWAAWPVTNFAEDTARGRFIVDWVWETKPLKTLSSTNTTSRYPSMHTGLMRKVVQKWHGHRLLDTGQEPPLGPNCGIFVPTGSGPVIERQRWVIVIERTGLYTFPIRFVDERAGLSALERAAFAGWNQDRQDRYDYGMLALPEFPALTVDSFADYDKLPADERRLYKVRLYAEADLDALWVDSYGGDKRVASDWYTPWAFDYDGRRACAVLIGTEPYNGTQRLYHSSLYELTFNQDGAGRPASVSVVTVKSDYLLTWTSSTAPGPNAPQPLSMPNPVAGALARFVWWGRPDGDYAAAQPAYRDAPVYAFYDRDNTRRALMHRYDLVDAAGTLEVIDTMGPASWNVVKPAGETYPAQYNNCNFTMPNSYIELRDDIEREYNCYYVADVIDPSPNETAKVLSVRHLPDGEDDGQWYYGGFGSYPPTSDTEAIWIYRQYIRQIRDPIHDVTFENYHHVGTPNYEREGLFFYQSLKETTTSRILAESRAGFDAYPGLNGRARWTGSGWTIISTHATASFTGYVSGWFGYQGGKVLPIIGIVDTQYTDPGGTVENERYVYVGSHSTANGALELTPPSDAASWFDDQEQIYEAANGAFTGDCIAAPWPGATCWEYTCDYPVDTSHRWTEYPPHFPDLVFVGDETTDAKTATRIIDLEAIRYG